MKIENYDFTKIPTLKFITRVNIICNSIRLYACAYLTIFSTSIQSVHQKMYNFNDPLKKI